MNRYGDVVPFHIGRRRALCVTGPEALQQLLEDRDDLFTKQTRGYDELSLFLGRGLLTSSGETWKRSRRVVAAHMQPSRLRALIPLITSSAERELSALARAAHAGRAIDVLPLATRLTLSVIGAVLVGVDLAAEASWMRESVQTLQEGASARISASYALPMWLPLAAHRRVSHASRTIRSYARALAANPAPGSLLEGWLRYAKQHAIPIDPEQIESEVVTFLLAGHESTANTLAWALYELAAAPDYDRACSERDDAALDAVFRETLRLYPQGWSFGRSAARDCELQGVRVRAGELLMAVPYATHRHPRHWPAPTRFDPTRFTRSHDRHRYSFVPFSAGRRACAGAALAALEVVETLRTWLPHFRFERVGQAALEPRITLRPKGGMWLRPIVR